MKKKLFLILSFIFLISFILGCSPEGCSTKSIQKQLFNPEDPCNLLQEEECLKNQTCMPIYEEFKTHSIVIKDDEYFSRCVSITPEMLNELEAEKILCKSSGGDWSLDSRYKLGICRCKPILPDEYKSHVIVPSSVLDPTIFITGKGCVNMRLICNEYGGNWTNERRYTLQRSSPNKCSLIPNSEWVKEEDSCLIYTDSGEHVKSSSCRINGTDMNLGIKGDSEIIFTRQG